MRLQHLAHLLRLEVAGQQDAGSSRWCLYFILEFFMRPARVLKHRWKQGIRCVFAAVGAEERKCACFCTSQDHGHSGQL